MSDRIDKDLNLAHALVRLADTLTDDFDIIDLLQQLAEDCESLVGSSAAGILLADADGRLEVAAASEESARMIEVLQVAGSAGPCVEAYRTGETIEVPDVAAMTRFPELRESLLAQGYRAVRAIPLRLRHTTIGSMNLFNSSAGPLSDSDATAADALADMAAISILQSRALDRAQALSRQLQNALDSRVVVEQAKGFLAYRHDTTFEDAFAMLRNHARANQIALSEVARLVIARELTL